MRIIFPHPWYYCWVEIYTLPNDKSAIRNCDYLKSPLISLSFFLWFYDRCSCVCCYNYRSSCKWRLRKYWLVSEKHITCLILSVGEALFDFSYYYYFPPSFFSFYYHALLLSSSSFSSSYKLLKLTNEQSPEHTARNAIAIFRNILSFPSYYARIMLLSIE